MCVCVCVCPYCCLWCFHSIAHWGKTFESVNKFEISIKSWDPVFGSMLYPSHKLKLLVVVNKAQFNPVNTRCGTHHTPTHNSQNSNSHIKFVPLNQFSPQQLFLHQICTQSHSTHVILQFNWLCDVCGCVMSPTSGIYWVDLGFINNYKELQLWLVLLRYSADVASAFPWVVTYGIKASPVTPCGLRDTTPQSGP